MGLAPTTSTTLMLALGDALAVALMERKGFSADQYRDLHPGGALGRALIRVSDIMHSGSSLPLVSPDTAMRDVLITMTAGGFGVAGVVDPSGALAGIITDGDLRRHMEPELLDRKAQEIMTANPKTVLPDMLAAEALAHMNNSTPKVTCLFVIDGDGATAPSRRNSARPRLSAGRFALMQGEIKKAQEFASAQLSYRARQFRVVARATLRGARRYSVFVRIHERRAAARRHLGLAIIVLVYVLQPPPSRLQMSFQRSRSLANDLSMDKPRLSGTDNDGQPFVISASRATPERTDSGSRPAAGHRCRFFSLRDGTAIHVTAGSGVVDTKTRLLQMSDGIHMVSQNGYEATTHNPRWPICAPATIHGENGIEANGALRPHHRATFRDEPQHQSNCASRAMSG